MRKRTEMKNPDLPSGRNSYIYRGEFSNGAAMKKSFFWKFGLATIVAFGLGACSNASVAENDDENSDLDDVVEGSSFGRPDDQPLDQPDVCDTQNTLSAPTGLQIAENGDNKWVLSWEYTANDNRPGSMFLIEVIDMSDSVPQWETLDTCDMNVTMYNLVGASHVGKYYRVLVRDDCGVSRGSNRMRVN